MNASRSLAWRSGVHGFCALATDLPGHLFWPPEVADDLTDPLVQACALPDHRSHPSN